MKKKLLAGLLAAPLATFLSAGQCLSEDFLPYKPILENVARTASARLYSDILSQECIRGRRYVTSQIKNGFKRHFEELGLALVDDGYTIVPNMTENNSLWSLSEMAFDAKRRLGIAPQFGCFRAYWYDN